ncbi:hypothetical protein Tco_1514949 [Tanacetum coccineum]
MSNSNTNLQTQTSNALHNAIMEEGGKDLHQFSEGSSKTTTEWYMENYKNVSQDIQDQLNAKAKAVQIILTGIDNDIYSTVDACPNACEMWNAIERLEQGESINVQDLETNLYWEFRKITSRDGESLESYYLRFYKMMNELVRNQCDVTNHQVHVQFLLQLQLEWQRGKVIVNSPPPTYDQEPKMVAKDDALSKEKEIDKLMALISLSFKKIYKPTNNNLRTSSNTSRAHQDNTSRINKGPYKLVHVKFDISSWRGARVDVRTYLLGGAIDSSKANGIIRDPKSCKVRVGSNGNLLWEASVLLGRKKGGYNVPGHTSAATHFWGCYKDEEERLAKEKAQKFEEANIAWDDIQAKVKVDYQLAQRLQAQDQEELSDAKKATLFIQLLEKRRKHFAAKRVEEKRNRPPTKSQQRSFMCTYLKNMEGWKPKDLKNNSKKAKAEIAQESSSKRAGEALEQESSKKQKVDDDKETKELKQCKEIILDDGYDATIEATPLSTKSSTIMHKNFNREDLEVLWSIVKARFKKTKPVSYMETFLHLNLKTMFEHHLEDNVWKNQQGLVKVLNWKLYDSCGVHCVTMQNILYYLLVEKMYPLTKHTLHQMFNDVKLQVEYECEMAFELLRLVKKQLKEGYGRIVGIKSLLEVTAAKLVLLVQKLLLLVFRVNDDGTKLQLLKD